MTLRLGGCCSTRRLTAQPRSFRGRAALVGGTTCGRGRSWCFLTTDATELPIRATISCSPRPCRRACLPLTNRAHANPGRSGTVRLARPAGSLKSRRRSVMDFSQPPSDVSGHLAATWRSSSESMHGPSGRSWNNEASVRVRRIRGPVSGDRRGRSRRPSVGGAPRRCDGRSPRRCCVA